MRHIVADQMLEEAADGGAPAVACGRGIRPLGFDPIEKALPEDEQDRVYLCVQRTINGSTVRFIEKLAKHSEALGAAGSRMADAGTTAAGPASSVTLAHLANETGLVG
jgi:hypothetical protein